MLMRRNVALSLLLAPVLTAGAAAQLDLPDKGGKDTTPPGHTKEGKTGDIAPHLTCSICGVANYTAPIKWDSENGMQSSHCSICRKATTHYLPRGKKRGAGIDLPKQPRAVNPARPVEVQDGGAPRVDDAEDHLSRAAEEILVTLEEVEQIDDPVALQASETLLALGGPGRVAARVALASNHGPKIMTGVRVLLRTGVPEDADVVAMRLGRRMPSRAASTALAALIELDPVRASSSFLCSLLDHPQQPMRTAAQRHLRDRDLTTYAEDLSPYLQAERSNTRWLALDLVARGEHPYKRDLVLTCLADKRAKVARRAIDALTLIEDPNLDGVLLARVFGERWILRPGAMALLALIEREDRYLQSPLGAGQIEALLRGLDSSDPLVSGACAAALAGIGFKSEEASYSVWLDGPVVQKLVESVSGIRYFEDHEALQETALRRLQLVSGVNYGPSGPAWVEWWYENRDDFVASRAVMPIVEGDELRLSLHFQDRGTGESFVLVGPKLSSDAPTDKGEVFYLEHDQSAELLTFLTEQGLFSVERLPGSRGGLAEFARVLEVRIGTRSKMFVFGTRISEPWFDQVVGRSRGLAERCAWQRFPHPSEHGDRVGLYRAEGAWWGGDHDAAARAARMESLILARMDVLLPEAREAEVMALAELQEQHGVLGAEDFDKMLGFLSEEPWLTRRAEVLMDLASAAAGDPASPEGTDRMWTLLDTIHHGFSADAMVILAERIAELGHRYAHQAAVDPRPLFRAVSAHGLSMEPGDLEIAALDELLIDDVIDVQVAAIEAIGREKLTRYQTEILARARGARPDVRAASLEALGFLGGDGARQALTQGLVDTDPRLQVASARGLRDLASPETSALLVSQLRGRTTPEVNQLVREALIALGPAAHQDLFSAMRSPSQAMRRESALLLSRQGVAAAAPVLMSQLAEDPADTPVERELCVLTCVDKRGEVDPSEAWFQWLDGVTQGDSMAWLRAAAEARRIPAPAADAFLGGGTRDALGFLAQIMNQPDGYLAERGRREMERMTGRQLGALPPFGVDRDEWIIALLEELELER